MDRIAVSSSRDSFVCGKQNFFYLADTVWAAFPRAKLNEWEQYLKTRRMQGFNVLQISILPILHDRTVGEDDRQPFALKEDGSYDFNSINLRYFETAKRMLKMALEHGFTPALVLLWGNYVKGTWSNNICPENTMTKEQAIQYAKFAIEQFKPFHPIYYISGDVDFRTNWDFSIYTKLFSLVKDLDPQALCSTHTVGDNTFFPDEIFKSPNFDFYSFQSGHGLWNNLKIKKVTNTFLDYPKKPLINSELCYEGFVMYTTDWKHSAFDVRRSVWHSLLSGAKAGVTYGAYGLWNWHREKDSYIDEERFGYSFNWFDALRFDGAYDIAFAKYIFETYDLFGIQPMDSLLQEQQPNDICLASSNNLDKIIIYSPFARKLKLNLNPGNYNWTAFDLNNRRIIYPYLIKKESNSYINIPPANQDILYIGNRIKFT